MSNRGHHFTSEMGGSIGNALSHPATGQFIGSLGALAVLTSPIWLTGIFLGQSLLLLMGGPEAASKVRLGSPFTPVVILLWPWAALAALFTLAYAVKTYRRRRLPRVARRHETARARTWARAMWICLLTVAGLGWFSGVYAEAAFRSAHPTLNSRLFLACPYLYPNGEANRTRILGDPYPGMTRGDTPGIWECWPYISKADKAKRCADPARGLPSERKALPVLCRP